jgi:outer membrane lipoprotein LolB
MVSASLAGCASLLSVPTLPTMLPATWEARRETLQSWGRFDSHGRVAIAREGEGFSGAWRWSQRAQRSTLELDGPLGVGGLRIDFEAEEARNVSSRRMLEEQLGVPLPVESLRYWMLGVPDPRVSVEEQMAINAPRLESLRQHGWTVTFKNYAPISGANYELPQRIEVTRESLRVRLIIEGWTGGVR